MTENNIQSKEGEGHKREIEVPLEGSLGLLAYGDLGLTAWRNAKKKAYREMVNAATTNTEPAPGNTPDHG